MDLQNLKMQLLYGVCKLNAIYSFYLNMHQTYCEYETQVLPLN